MGMVKCIECEAAVNAVLNLVPKVDDDGYCWVIRGDAARAIDSIPAADVLPRDEGIKLGAELAAMHGSDATSQELEKAYLEGVAEGMKRRDVKPVVRGKWQFHMFTANSWGYECRVCHTTWDAPTNFCPNCGAMMEES